MLWGDDNEKKTLDTQNKICSAMTPVELETGKIAAKDKMQIAEAAQVQREEVEDLI